ncbi:MAG TPA: energy transducer TonB, partial [Cyanothece sp. UBA12306]|nr:energy transducer TonB [Cyanothece sp. UBA12306]
MPMRLFNSNSLAVVTSVGIHALVLGLAIPSFTNLAPQKNPTPQRNVEIIELTAAELARLPNPSASSLDIPEFPDTSLGEIPVLDSPSLDPSLPSNFNNLPAPPVLPPLPNLPPLGSGYRPIPRPMRSMPIAPPPSGSLRLPAPPLGNSSPQVSALPPREGSRTPERPNFEPLKAPIPIDVLINQGKGQPPQQLSPSEQIAVNGTPNEVTINQDQARQDRIIRNLVRDTLQGAENLRYNNTNTKNEDARQNDARWMAQTGVPVGKNNWQNLVGIYPKAACSRKLEGTAIYGIAVNGQGNVVKNPYLIKSSGYGLFNQQALSQIKSSQFSSPGNYRVRVSFQFDPKKCPGVYKNSPTTETPNNSQPSTP